MNRYTLPLLIFALLLSALLGTSATALGQFSLAINKAPADVSVVDISDPEHFVWTTVEAKPLLLHLTPSLNLEGALDDGSRPAANVRLLRMGDGSLAARLQWDDRSRNEGATSARYPDGGQETLYTRHTKHADRFADGACMMVPQRRGKWDRYPSLMMGSVKNPIDLIFWRANSGFELLRASGRGTVEKTGTPVNSGVSYNNGQWSVVFILYNMPPQTPISFANWDGAKKHRDGGKYFSLWYEIR
jgi:hypothetical protein